MNYAAIQHYYFVKLGRKSMLKILKNTLFFTLKPYFEIVFALSLEVLVAQRQFRYMLSPHPSLLSRINPLAVRDLVQKLQNF